MDRFGSERMWFMPIICVAICLIIFLVFRRSGRGPFFFDRTKRMDNLDNRNSSAIEILNKKLDIPILLLLRDVTELIEDISDKAEDASDALCVLAFAM